MLEGFCELDKAGIDRLISAYGLAMDADDAARVCRLLKNEGRDP